MPKFTLAIEGMEPFSGELALPPGAGLNRYRVKRDQDTRKWKHAVRPAAVRQGSAPAVFRTGVIENNESFARAQFTEAWQWFAVQLLAKAKFGLSFDGLAGEQRDYILRAFSSLYQSNRAFTNGKGVDNCNSYPTGETGRGEDPRIDPLICADDVIAGGAVRNAQGRWMVKVLSFRQNEAPPIPDLADPRVMWATIIRRDGDIRNFPQLGGDRVPYPLISVEPYFYPLEELVPL